MTEVHFSAKLMRGDLGVIPQKKSSFWYFRAFLAVEVGVSNNFNSLAFAQRERERELKMSRVIDDVAAAVNHLFDIPETMEKFTTPSRSPHQETNKSKGVSSIPVDILDSPKDYIFFMDVPGLPKSDIQVTVEDERTLVIRSNGKRKREDGEEEGCKYIRLERRVPRKLLRKFKLPEDANASAISAKCENGVLTIAVGKLPPPPKPKTVEVAIS